MLLSYKTVLKPAKATLEIKKSRFITNVAPAKSEEDALEFIEQVRRVHRNATHNVFAFTIGENHDLQRISDDGEPAGTAGKPVLDVIIKEDLRDVVVVVTRYFGGIKLGANGLIRAYGNSAREGIRACEIVKKKLYYEASLELNYSLFGKFQNLAAQAGCLIGKINYSSAVSANILVPFQHQEKIAKEINELSGGKAMLCWKNPVYLTFDENREKILK